MAEYVNKSMLYSLCEPRGIVTLHVSDIDAMPSEDVAPVVHGKWVYNKNANDWGIGGYVCSECKNKNNNLPCNRVKSVRKMDMEQEEPTE